MYEELAEAYAHASGDLIIANVDADAHRELGGRFGVRGYPTIKFFKRGSTTPSDYESGRDLQAFVDYLTRETGMSLGYVATLVAHASARCPRQDCHEARVCQQARRVQL